VLVLYRLPVRNEWNYKERRGVALLVRLWITQMVAAQQHANSTKQPPRAAGGKVKRR